MSLTNELNDIQQKKRELEVAEELAINKALRSENPADIVKAMEVVEITYNKAGDRKAVFVDPLEFNENFGYKNAATSLSYDALYRMSKTPIINAILKTRKSQIADFAKPQENRFTSGFIILPKTFNERDRGEITSEESKEIAEITEFIINCGYNQSWSRDDFDTFLRKIVDDSLIYDQMCFEVVRDRKGRVHEFLAIDSSSVRIADSYFDEEYEKRREKFGLDKRTAIAGYYPSYVQVLRNNIVSEYYPWELCFGVRNGSTGLKLQGYGRSELEDMVAIVTSQLWSDQYNQNFFKQGAAPKGILKIKGGSSNPKLEEFKQQWRAMIAGVQNAWRTPIIDAQEMEWIDLQKSSRDMEFSKWQEYLIKLSCALYTIDPAEIGFPSSSGGDMKPLFETQNAAKVKYSKDKGLRPLLTFIENKINKYIISQLNTKYIFKFVGLDIEDEAQYRTRLKEEVTNYKTVNEIRKEIGLPPLKEGGDIILNGVYTSALQQQKMLEQQEQMAGGGAEEGAPEGGEEGQEEENPFLKALESENPYVRDFNEFVDSLWK